MIKLEYVLVNMDNPYHVLGPFKSLEEAQKFRELHKEVLSRFMALRTRNPQLFVMAEKHRLKTE